MADLHFTEGVRIAFNSKDTPAAGPVADRAENSASSIDLDMPSPGEREPDPETGRPGSILCPLPARLYTASGGKLYRVALRIVDATENNKRFTSEDIAAMRSDPHYFSLIYMVRIGHEEEDAALLDAEVDARFADDPAMPAMEIWDSSRNEYVYRTAFGQTGAIVELVAVVAEDIRPERREAA